MMELVGGQLRLRPLTSADLTQMVVWNRDPEVQLFVDCDLPTELTALQEWYHTNIPDRHYQIFIIEVAGLPVGDLELDHICWKKREAELRIRIGDKNYWNRGLGSEALHLILDYFLAERKLQRLYLRVYDFNKRAIRCYQKNGFKQIGFLHREDREWKNIILMEINIHHYRKQVAKKIS